MSSTSVLELRNSVPLDITVILCTYNRCRDLAGALESIAESEVASSITWEVLVVDNNSTDQTRDVVQKFCQRRPQRFRYIFEPKQGRSFALNAGIENSRGRLLAFTDDDVTVERTWLQNLTAALHNGKWAGAGGRILPAENFTAPAWLPQDMALYGGILFAYFDVGDKTIQLNGAPFGANMAFRRSMFAKYGAFRTDLGHTGGDMIGNEDTEFGNRLMMAGERLRYEPTATVYHAVPRERLTQKYFLSWWFDCGRAMIRERGDRPAVCGIPRDYLALICRVVEILTQTLQGMFASSPSQRFSSRCRVSKNKGQIAELRRSLDQKRGKAALAAPVDS